MIVIGVSELIAILHIEIAEAAYIRSRVQGSRIVIVDESSVSAGASSWRYIIADVPS